MGLPRAFDLAESQTVIAAHHVTYAPSAVVRSAEHGFHLLGHSLAILGRDASDSQRTPHRGRRKIQHGAEAIRIARPQPLLSALLRAPQRWGVLVLQAWTYAHCHKVNRLELGGHGRYGAG